MIQAVVLVLACAVSTAPEVPSPKPAWSGWRGPARDGTVPHGEWPADLDGVEKIWRVPLGPSYSGPVVDAKRVFVTETRDRKMEAVRALDRETGKELSCPRRRDEAPRRRKE